MSVPTLLDQNKNEDNNPLQTDRLTAVSNQFKTKQSPVLRPATLGSTSITRLNDKKNFIIAKKM